MQGVYANYQSIECTIMTENSSHRQERKKRNVVKSHDNALYFTCKHLCLIPSLYLKRACVIHFIPQKHFTIIGS